MNSDDFEKRLRSQPLRRVPPEWRNHILCTAAAADTRRSSANRPLLVSKLWRELVWPVRRVWIGFAFVWVAIIAINFADAERSGQLEASVKVPPDNLITVWERQQELLTELNSPENPDLDKPRQNVPKPRSDRHSAQATV